MNKLKELKNALIVMLGFLFIIFEIYTLIPLQWYEIVYIIVAVIIFIIIKRKEVRYWKLRKDKIPIWKKQVFSMGFIILSNLIAIVYLFWFK